MPTLRSVLNRIKNRTAPPKKSQTQTKVEFDTMVHEMTADLNLKPQE